MEYSDEKEKDEVAMAMQSRIESPIQWDSPKFAKIIDLKETHYDEVLRLIKVQSIMHYRE